MQSAVSSVRSGSHFETALPLGTRFRATESATREQREFLDLYGFLVFARLASNPELEGLLRAIDRIEDDWTNEARRSVLGAPILTDRAGDGRRVIRRFPFTSCFSNEIRTFVRDPRLLAVRMLLGEDTVVDDEQGHGAVFRKNGVDPEIMGRAGVSNAASRTSGWRSGSLRDLLYWKSPQQMLSPRLHFDHSHRDAGGLRFIPGTHTQGVLSMCLRKPWLLGSTPDRDEVALETEPGDVTIIDKRLWRRIQEPRGPAQHGLQRTLELPYFDRAKSSKKVTR